MADLSDQIAYYKARAGEYDDWWLRRGRYDAGPEHTGRWKAEIAELRAELDAFGISGDVLELAGGTGNWSVYLAKRAATLTIVDAAAETLQINRRKIVALPRAAELRHIEADLFAWEPDERYDIVFFSFWLSHVPEDRFDEFWSMVARAVRPGGRFFLIDSRFDPQIQGAGVGAATYPDAVTSVRTLEDGTSYQIVKVFREPDDLTMALTKRGWQVTSGVTGSSFMWAHGRAG